MFALSTVPCSEDCGRTGRTCTAQASATAVVAGKQLRGRHDGGAMVADQIADRECRCSGSWTS